MMNQFRAISLNHHSAPLGIREKYALTYQEIGQLAGQLRDVFGIEEGMVLSTCNRTEVYYTSSKDISSEVIGWVTQMKSFGDEDAQSYFHTFEKEKAVDHLYRVALGLESSVIGDLQITHQVKAAYQLSADLDMAGPFLHRLMHSIFYSNKRVVQETTFRDGAASVPYATVEMLNTLVQQNKEVDVLVVGLGEMGENVARNLSSNGYQQVTLANRTRNKAESLASELEYGVIDFLSVRSKVNDFDVIISAIQVEDPFIYESDFDQSLPTHRFIIDLSVPRSIDESVENIPAVVLSNIDEIKEITKGALEKRLAAIPKVEELIGEAISELSVWVQDMAFSPTINKIKDALETIRTQEVEKYLKQLQLSEEDSQVIDTVTKSIVNKIMKLPVLQLKAACRRGDGEQLADVLNDLFDLERNKKKA